MVTVMFSSCDQTDSFFESTLVNEKPGFELQVGDKQGAFISDSLKRSDAAGVFLKEIYLNYSDVNQNIDRLLISSTTNDVFIIQEDTILIDETVVVAESEIDSIKLEILSFSEGIKQLRFQLFDSFEKDSVAELEMLVFNNMIPIAAETHSIDQTNSIVTFDFSNSYDQDALYGGQVVEYELKFNGETLIRTEPTMTVAYSSSVRLYDYSYRVKDNNGDYSELIVDRINLDNL